MSSAAAVALPPLDNTMGALLIGVFIAAGLWGVTCSQTFMYFTTYHQDSFWLKCIVALVWAFDTTHQALICHLTYDYLVTNYSSPAHLGVLVNTVVIEVFFNGFVALLVQSFFVRRIWILSKKNWFLTCLVMFFVLGEFVFVMIYGIRGLAFSKLADLGKLKAISITVNALAAAGDVLIAFILCWILQTSRTGFQASDTMITKLIAFAVNTGLVTSICALASLITITTLPNTFIYITFYFTLGRLYSNSLLATLNARRALRGQTGMEEYSMGSTGHRAQADKSFGNFVKSNTMNPATMSIKVDTTQETDYDYSDHSLPDVKRSAPWDRQQRGAEAV